MSSRPVARARRAVLPLITAAVVLGSTAAAAACLVEDPAASDAVPAAGSPAAQRAADAGRVSSPRTEAPPAASATPVEEPLPSTGSAEPPVEPADEPSVPEVPAEPSSGTGGTPAHAPSSPARAAAGTGSPAAVPAGTWLSGNSGPGVVTGEVAAWRGRPSEIAGTWSDNNQAMVNLWQILPGYEYGAWRGPMDIAIGAIGPGETWQAAAQGAYDARWRQSLTLLRDQWQHRGSALYIRFAHEMNGNWYPWSVDAGERTAFIESWRRFRALQEQIYPDAQLVFCVNRESVGAGLDWRTLFPGAQYVDVMGVDYYNQYPHVTSAAEWAASMRLTDQFGGPKGLQGHLDFARSVGLPLAIPEWSGNADFGDSPAFVEGLYQFLSANAGGGPGQVLYEIQFNVPMDHDQFVLFPGGSLPATAQRYRDLW